MIFLILYIVGAIITAILCGYINQSKQTNRVNAGAQGSDHCSSRSIKYPVLFGKWLANK